jgi:hypothetical protein
MRDKMALITNDLDSAGHPVKYRYSIAIKTGRFELAVISPNGMPEGEKEKLNITVDISGNLGENGIRPEV